MVVLMILADLNIFLFIEVRNQGARRDYDIAMLVNDIVSIKRLKITSHTLYR